VTVTVLLETLRRRIRSWLDQWAALVPLMSAEFVLWTGFAALIPVMPLYFRDHGVDLATLGVVVAAWPAARFVFEPIFGWLADRTARKPFMVVGLIVAGVATVLPLVFTGPAAFFVLRALAGVGAAAFDPSARGHVTDTTPSNRRGEAFGLWGAAQMGGVLLGPAIGGFVAFLVGVQAIFVLCGIAAVVASAIVAAWLREAPRTTTSRALGPTPVTELNPETTQLPGRALLEGQPTDARTAGVGPAAAATPSADRPRSLLNRILAVAVIVNAGAYFGIGAYEVVWSIYLDGMGAGLELIGLTLTAFGLPVLLLSPYAGRLVDRRGALAFAVGGTLVSAVAAYLYTIPTEPLWFIPLSLFEGTGYAFSGPALYAIVALGSPRGRASTAQGIFGAAGTFGFIIASVLAGFLAEGDLRVPFYAFAVVLAASLAVALLVGGGAVRRAERGTSAGPPAAKNRQDEIDAVAVVR
jgi:DHA1 family multidrug resistance protein-like MFS transporter